MQDSSKNIIEFTLVFNKYKTKLFNYIIKMIPDRMTGEDILQDVFLKFYQNIDSIKNKNSILFWLFTTARNEIYMYYRSKKIKADQFNVEDSDALEIKNNNNPADIFDLKEMKEIINNELHLFPIEQKEVFIMKEYGNLTYKEISSILKIDENLVKSRLYKIRQKLIERISKIIKD